MAHLDKVVEPTLISLKGVLKVLMKYIIDICWPSSFFWAYLKLTMGMGKQRKRNS